MEGSVEYGCIKLLILKRQMLELRLESRQSFRQVLLIVVGSSQAIVRIRQQVDPDHDVTGPRQTVTHPAVSRPQVENLGAKRQRRRENTIEQVLVSPRPDSPLIRVPVGCVAKGQVEIEVGAVAASSFLGTNMFVLRDETRIVLHPFRSQRMDD